MMRTFALLAGTTMMLGSLAIVPPAHAAMRYFGQGRSYGYYGYSPGYIYPPRRVYGYRPGHPYEFDRQLSGRP
jgi:hypothetical protein